MSQTRNSDDESDNLGGDFDPHDDPGGEGVWSASDASSHAGDLEERPGRDGAAARSERLENRAFRRKQARRKGSKARAWHLSSQQEWLLRDRIIFEVKKRSTAALAIRNTTNPRE
jgi:hypothetical protein